jgi:hypothetical protein
MATLGNPQRVLFDQGGRSQIASTNEAIWMRSRAGFAAPGQ